MQEGKQRPIELTEAEIRQAAAGKSEELMEKQIKPMQLTEAEIREAAEGKSETVFQRKAKHKKD